ncbi:hypothetical protein LGL55_18040 [Clostridium tagluense]|uniref:hypothetical protein n=1 Tax=Clostridium tagluense TaxID=360422 RepID=UPI001CF0F0E1|nr:hypothetical protein [Clostridium tagluense]MCB2313160.1 hypothetical protein [Clostridium tagluense]MCB2317926.1 hypothetical protein [Clostridium tagluense]MCB2322762.1 hypothetical protein [Clostridium tagluense]MCB2327760.1 hypothetical protein [Clostridium tagluense]MCB2332407.1 hypothetical protein [Clostridium tagluense]
MMNLEGRNFEDTDMDEEYEMIPFEPMMYGYGQMNSMPNMGMNTSMGMNPNMGRPMEYMQDVNPNMEMDPGIGMNQFNEDMSMNGLDSMSMMYGDASMKDYGDENEGLRQMDKYEDEGEYNNQNRVNPKYNDVDAIVRKIERYNPAIFRSLTRYGMPYAEARNIVRRIVRLTLMYSEE